MDNSLVQVSKEYKAIHGKEVLILVVMDNSLVLALDTEDTSVTGS